MDRRNLKKVHDDLSNFSSTRPIVNDVNSPNPWHPPDDKDTALQIQGQNLQSILTLVPYGQHPQQHDTTIENACQGKEPTQLEK